MPYVMARAGIYGLIGIGALIYFGVLGLLVAVLKSAGGLAAIIFLVGTGGFIAIMKLLQHAVLYAVKAGHIAVLTELIQRDALPEGVNQFSYGKDLIKTRFKDVAIMFAVDRLVAGVLRSFNRKVARVADWLPIPGLEGLAGLITTLVNFSISFVDEAILSYAVAREDDNLWNSAKQGVILYAQEWKPILLASAVMGAIHAVCFMIIFIPLALVLGLLLPGYGWGALVIALVLAFLVREAFVRPWAMATIILTFHRETAGKQPDVEWEARLESFSDKFKELKEKALEFARARTSGGAAGGEAAAQGDPATWDEDTDPGI